MKHTFIYIIAGTLILRTLLSPLVLKSQKASAKMSKHMPEIVKMQKKMSDARQSGNNLEGKLFLLFTYECI